MKLKSTLKLFHLCLLPSAFCLSALAQGTAFTYEGQLRINGNPAAGTYNLKFTPFNALSGGSALTAPVTNNNVAVANGLFTVQIDFGPGVFTGQTIWLELGARTNGVSTFTTLTPRQQLTPAPYAIYAESAGNLNGPVSASQLTSIGNGAGGVGNFFVGPSGNSTTSGYYNTANGLEALSSNTIGYFNTANGVAALNGNTSGSDNTGTGADALSSNTSGYGNTGNGMEALSANTSGSDNTAIGFQAIYVNQSGDNNTAMGADALENLAAGSGNIAIGVNAGNAISTGNDNIDIGNPGFGDESGVIRIGTTQTKAVFNGIYPTTITSSAGLVCVNPSGLLGTGTMGGAFLGSDLQIGTDAGEYRHLRLSGGNAWGYLYGSYLNPFLGDGVHLGYNWYSDAGGTGHVINTGGGTSRISTGYGEIVLAVGGVNSAPTGPGTTRLDATTAGVTVYGTFNNLSDRNAKQDFAQVSPRQILDKVVQLPLSEWSYKVDAATRHIGPVAQDFYSVFNLGTDEKHIAPIDEGGVALAAIQGLNEKVEGRSQKAESSIGRLEAENAELRQQNESLEIRLEALEKIVCNQKSN